MSVTNEDGLFVRFGTELATVGAGGDSNTSGNTRVITLDVDSANFPAFGTEGVLSENVIIPKGAFIKSASIVVTEAFTSGGAATLTLGLIKNDRSTAYDADGIDVAIALSSLNAIGKTVACDGAVISSIISGTVPVLPTVTVGTANYTAGKAQIVIEYFIP